MGKRRRNFNCVGGRDQVEVLRSRKAELHLNTARGYLQERAVGKDWGSALDGRAVAERLHVYRVSMGARQDH